MQVQPDFTLFNLIVILGVVFLFLGIEVTDKTTEFIEGTESGAFAKRMGSMCRESRAKWYTFWLGSITVARFLFSIAGYLVHQMFLFKYPDLIAERAVVFASLFLLCPFAIWGKLRDISGII